MKQAKRILMAAMAAMLVFVFAGCGGQDTNTPEGAFNAGIAAVKDCDTAAMDKYLTGDPASELSDGFAQWSDTLKPHTQGDIIKHRKGAADGTKIHGRI